MKTKNAQTIVGRFFIAHLANKLKYFNLQVWQTKVARYSEWNEVSIEL